MALESNIPSGPLAQKWDKHKFELKLVNPANKRKFEVIVVGSGLAGASAAAPPSSCRPRLVPYGAAHTSHAMALGRLSPLSSRALIQCCRHDAWT